MTTWAVPTSYHDDNTGRTYHIFTKHRPRRVRKSAVCYGRKKYLVNTRLVRRLVPTLLHDRNDRADAAGATGKLADRIFRIDDRHHNRYDGRDG